MQRARLADHPRQEGADIALAVEIARLPEQIRGYGHVKHRNLQAVRPQWEQLLQQWRGQAQERRAA